MMKRKCKAYYQPAWRILLNVLDVSTASDLTYFGEHGEDVKCVHALDVTYSATGHNQLNIGWVRQTFRPRTCDASTFLAGLWVETLSKPRLSDLKPMFCNTSYFSTGGARGKKKPETWPPTKAHSQRGVYRRLGRSLAEEQKTLEVGSCSSLFVCVFGHKKIKTIKHGTSIMHRKLSGEDKK